MLDITLAKVKAVAIERRVWIETGLDAHVVMALVELPDENGQLHLVTEKLDAHWQEVTARQCANRWADYYGVGVVPFVALRKAVQ